MGCWRGERVHVALVHEGHDVECHEREGMGSIVRRPPSLPTRVFATRVLTTRVLTTVAFRTPRVHRPAVE